MATTKKFAQMSTKKLNALLETANEEDAVAIKAILESRNAAKAAEEAPATSAELSPEEQAAIDAAESEETEAKPAKKEKKSAGRKAVEKMTMEELDAKTEECKESVNHRCSILINGTAIRVNGTITGVLKDKRAMQVYFAVQTDETDETESKRMYKKWNAEDLEITDEVVAVKAKKTNSTARTRKEKMTEEEWAAERDTILALASENVGKKVNLGEGSDNGVIVSLLVDKRSYGIYYRIEFEDELGMKKTTHKVITTVKNEETGATELAELQGMAAELDEEGLKLNEAYKERKAREPRKVLTPEERVLKAREDVKKAEATLAKAQETLTMRKNTLELAEKDLENKLNAQEANVTGQGVAQAEDNDDLA